MHREINNGVIESEDKYTYNDEDHHNPRNHASITIYHSYHNK